MATYNRAEYLTRSVGSVLTQTYQAWELIIIDDGSEDNTFDVVRAYQARSNHIRYMRQGNHGPALARNAGIALSVGLYVTFLDSDDEYKPEHLESRIQYMEANKEVRFIHGGFEIIGDEYVPDINDMTKQIHLSKCAWEGSYVGYRELVVESGGFRSFPYQDLASGPDLITRLEQKAVVKKIIGPKTVIYHRDTPNSITKRK